MLIGAVAEVGEHVLDVGKAGEADEGRALAAHLGEGAGVRAVVQRHEVAADAGTGKTAVGQLCRGGVRASGAECRDAAEQAVRALDRERRRRGGEVQAGPAEERAEASGHAFRRQFHQRRNQRRHRAGRSCR